MDGVIVAILAVIGYSLYAKTTHAANLVFYPSSITGLAFEGSSPVIYADLLIQNASDSSFTLSSLAGNLYTDDTLVGNVSSFQPLQIPANSQVTYPLTFRLSLIGLTNDIISAIQSGVYPKKIHLDAKANGDGVQLPIDVVYQIN
jgi:LEA14-like dessication related protein